MSNSLFNSLNKGSQNANMSDLKQQIINFRNNLNGNPQQKVEELLRSGRMSQSEYNKYRDMANQIMRFFN